MYKYKFLALSTQAIHIVDNFINNGVEKNCYFLKNVI